MPSPICAILSETPLSHKQFIYLDHVFLYTGALMAPEDREQLIVRDEEKSREGVPLGVQVVIETLLTSLQSILNRLEVLEPILSVTGIQD